MKNKFLLGPLIFAVGSVPGQAPEIISLGQLLSNPAIYDGKILRLRACAVKGLEQFGIRECESTPNFSPRVCLDDYMHAYLENRVLGPDHRGPAYNEPTRSPAEVRLYRRLMTARSGTRLKVELEGEIQQSKDEAFGPGCSSRIIIHRVLTLAPE
jgi:hypothetical protein